MKKALSFIMASALAFNAAAMVTSAETAYVSSSYAQANSESGWVTKNGKKYYKDENGKYLTGVKEIDGKTYWFSKKGVMQTGWRTLSSGKKMYFRSSGEMATGWVIIGKDKYYFSSKGIMQTGDIIINKKVYRFKSSGVYDTMPRNELVTINGKTYGTTSSGTLASGLVCIDDDYYYFGKNGYAVAATVEKDGYIYNVDEDGLISREKKAEDYSKVNVKIPPFVNSYINVYDLKLKNSSDGSSVAVTGWIKPLNYADYKVTITIALYDQDGSFIGEMDLADRDLVKYGEPFKINYTVFTDSPVYSIKFTNVVVR